MPIVFKKGGIVLFLLHSFFFQLFVSKGFNSVILLFLAFGLILLSVLEKGETGILTIQSFYPEQMAWVLLLIWSVIGNYDLFNLDSFNGVFTLTAGTLLLLWKNTDWIDFFINCLLAFAFIHAFCTVLFFFVPALNSTIPGWFNLVKEQPSYISGISGHYSTNGMYISLGMIAAAVKVFTGHKKWIAPAVVFLFANLLTAKRGPFFFSVTALFLLYFITFKINFKALIRLVIVIAAVVFIVVRFALSNPEVLNGIARIVVTFQGINTDLTVLGGRKALYTIALNMFKERPTLGYGWGAYLAMTGLPMVHNVYLQMLAECGIIGLIIFLFCLIRSCVRCSLLLLNAKTVQMSKNKRYHLMFSFAVQSFFIMYGLTGNPLYDGVITIPVLMSYGICYAERREVLSSAISLKSLKARSAKGDICCGE